MRIDTIEEYRLRRQELDAANKAIDSAPTNRKPVFKGIVALHAAVTRFERRLNQGRKRNA